MWPIRDQRPQRWQDSPSEDPKEILGRCLAAREIVIKEYAHLCEALDEQPRKPKAAYSGDEPAADRSGFASSRLCRAGVDRTAYYRVSAGGSTPTRRCARDSTALAAPAAARVSLVDEQRQGRHLIGQLPAGTKTCRELSATDFDHDGEYAMYDRHAASSVALARYPYRESHPS